MNNRGLYNVGSVFTKIYEGLINALNRIPEANWVKYIINTSNETCLIIKKFMGDVCKIFVNFT